MGEVKKFFLRFNETTYLKVIKIQLMESNCRKSNFGDVINELTEYLMDVEVVKEVMEALDKIIMKF